MCSDRNPRDRIADGGRPVANGRQSVADGGFVPAPPVNDWMGDWSRRRARLSPDAVGLVDATTGREFTYRTLDARANRVARAPRPRCRPRRPRGGRLPQPPGAGRSLLRHGGTRSVLAPISHRLAPPTLAVDDSTRTDSGAEPHDETSDTDDLIDARWDRGVELSQGYGLTECGPNNFVMPDWWDRSKTDTVGVPAMHVDARVVDSDGEPLPQGP